MEHLKNTLPKSEYDKLKKLYNFCYNIFVFIYKIDNSLVDYFNFIINYILHKEIENNIMHNDICLGRTDVVFINELDIFYIKMAGSNLVLEDILLEQKLLHNPNKKKKYSILQSFDLELEPNQDIFDKIFKKATIDYINKIYKILFYIELLNKNDISKETLTNIKNRINNYQLNNTTK